MKKIVLLALTALMIAGCDSKNADCSYDTSKSIYLQTTTIDSCEYIQGYNRNRLAHKGNCRFCKERRQKELKELVIKLKEK